MAFDTRLLTGIGVFAAVVETGSFARAGETLGITGSGVSRAIARLEERVGIRLMERSPRAVVLTPEGRKFHARVSPLLEEAELAAAEVSGGKEVVTGHLRVSSDAPSARFVIAPALPKLLAAHPGLSVEIVVREQLGDLVSEGLDAGVRFEEPAEMQEGVVLLGSTAIVTAASPTFLARNGMPIHPAELELIPCILMRNPVNRVPYPWSFRREGEKVELRPRTSVIANDGTTMFVSCLEGAGVAQLLEIEAREAFSSGALIRLFSEWENERYSCRLHTSGGRFRSPRLAAFSELIRQTAGDLFA